jgi:hypothetical protein
MCKCVLYSFHPHWLWCPCMQEKRVVAGLMTMACVTNYLSFCRIQHVDFKMETGRRFLSCRTFVWNFFVKENW